MIGNSNFGFSGGGSSAPPPVNNSWLLDGNTNGAVKYFGTNDNFGVPIYTNGTQIGVFTETGNFGFGINLPTSRVHVKGSDSTSGAFGLKVDNSSSSPLLYVRNDGNVGVGIAIPTALLHVYSTADKAIRVDTNSASSYTGKKYEIEVGGGQWGLGFSAANNALTLLTTGSSTGNFIFGYGTEASPTPKFYYNSTLGGLAVNVALGSINGVGHFKMPSVGLAADNILLSETSAGVYRFKVQNDGTTLLKGGDATSSNYSLKIDNSASTALLYVRNDGNVGVNIASPTEKFEVTGNIKLTSYSNKFIINSQDALAMSQGAGSANIIIGSGNTMNDASNGGGIVIGMGSTCTANGISIGLNSIINVAAEDGIAIGRDARVFSGVIRGGAIGRQAFSQASGSWAIGNYCLATQDDTIILGNATAGNKQDVGIAYATPSARLHVQGKDATAGNFVFKLDSSASTNLVSIANNGAGVFNSTLDGETSGNNNWKYSVVTGGIRRGHYANTSYGIIDDYYSNSVLKTQIIENTGLYSISATNRFSLKTLGDNLTRLFMDSTGNIGISNTFFTTSANLHVQGIDATSSNYSLKVDNSASTALFYVRNDGVSLFNTNAIYATNFSYDVKIQLFSNPNSSNGNYFSLATGGGSILQATLSRRNSGVVKSELYFIESNDTTYLAIGAIGDADKALSFRTNDTNRLYITHSGNIGISQITPLAKMHIFGVDSTGVNLRLEPVTNVTEDTSGNTVNTTDATANVTAQTIAIPTNKVVSLESTIVYRKTGGAGLGTTGDGTTFKLNSSVKNVAGTLTLDTVQNTYTGTVNAIVGVTATYTISGTNVLVSVTGVVNDNITWDVITKVVS